MSRDSRASRFSPEAPLGDLPKIVEKMSAADVDSVLRLIAQQARLVTAATGAAIALGANAQFFCRASTGDTAPPVGVPVHGDSGLTGECIHRRVTLRCDDAEKDDRVDPIACRELQVRSIAVVPVRVGDELAGVLEVFSNHVSAFTNSHLATLEEIAELIADVFRRAATLIVASASSTAAENPELLIAAAARDTGAPAPTVVSQPVRARTGEIVAKASQHLKAVFAGRRIQVAGLADVPRLWLVSGAAFVLIVASVGLILGLRRSGTRLQTSQAVTTQAVPQAAPQAPVPQTPTPVSETTAAPVATPTPVVPAVSDKAPKAKAPAPPLDDEVVVLKVAPASAPVPVQRVPESETPPPDLSNLAGTGSASNLGILTASVATPKLAPPRAPVSQGVIPGRLIHKVAPVYPEPAREARLQGQVVLSITVQKNGRVGKVRVLRGHPLLARAAVQAVKEWRYEPFRLNGQAVEVESQVTIKFTE